MERLSVTCSCIRSFLIEATSEIRGSELGGRVGESDLESSGVSSEGGNLEYQYLNMSSGRDHELPILQIQHADVAL